MLKLHKNQTQKTTTLVNHLERNYTLLLCLLLALFGGLLPSLASEGQTIHASKDTYVRINNNGPWGDNVRIRVDNDGGQGTRRLVGIVQFRHNPSNFIEDAELHLDVETFTHHANSADFSLWGVVEEDTEEEWNEDSAKWNYFDRFLDNSDDGVTAFKLQGNAPLAQFTVSYQDINKTISVGGSNVADFVKRNKNQVITFVIIRDTENYNFRTAFASREHESLNPPRLFITQEEAVFTPEDDAYVREGYPQDYGSQPHIYVKKAGGGSAPNVRRGLIEFKADRFRSIVAKNATLLLDVSGFNDNGGKNKSKFWVWGIKDGTSLENFDENTVKYVNYNSIFNQSGDGVKNDSPNLFDGNLSQNNVQPLGAFTIWKSQVGHPAAFTSSALVDFINDNRDAYLTFAITRHTDSGSLNTFFASKEHPTLNPPRLHIQSLLQEVTPNSNSEFTYMDVDHDGHDDLVLIVNEPEGGGFAVAEPFIIAEYMEKVGIGIGEAASDAYYQKLSPSQRQSLHNGLYAIANNDCVQQVASIAITAVQIRNAMIGLPPEREYPVTHFPVRANLETQVNRNKINIMVEIEGCTLFEYSYGDLTVTVSGPSAQAGFYISDGGMAFGAEASTITVAVTYGDTDGTYAGVSISDGYGYFFAASWGDNGQYGFSVPVPYTPLGVSVYVKGKDAVAVYNLHKDAAILGGTALADFYEGEWLNAVDWSENTFASAQNSVNDTKIFMERNGDYAKVWVEDQGEKTLTDMKGTATQITNEMNDLSNTLETTTSGLADALENWAEDSETVVSNLWNDASGFVEGAANTVQKAIKKVTKWF